MPGSPSTTTSNRSPRFARSPASAKTARSRARPTNDDATCASQAGRAERKEEQLPRRLSQRRGRKEGRSRCDDSFVRTALEFEREALLRRVEIQTVEMVHVRAREHLTAELAVGRATPKCQGGSELIESRVRPAAPFQVARLVDERLETMRVDVGGRDREPIRPGSGLDQFGIAQGAPQARHMTLQ